MRKTIYLLLAAMLVLGLTLTGCKKTKEEPGTDTSDMQMEEGTADEASVDVSFRIGNDNESEGVAVGVRIGE